MKKLLYYILWFFWFILAFIVGVNFYVISFSFDDYYTSLSDIKENNLTWIVFWASIIDNKIPSNILKDRLNSAYEWYNNSIIDKIIVSWDSQNRNYNESDVMRQYLVDKWVSENDIVVDYYWLDTYDAIYRAKNVFWETELVLFTQDFHLKRAIYISNRLWIETYWFETSIQNYKKDYNIREVLARVKAFLEIEIFKPKYWDGILKKDKLFD